MNCFIWNCRVAGGKYFSNIVRDCTKMYSIDFLVILEPRISGERANSVIESLGFDSKAKVDAIGYSGGIWCLWKFSSVNITIISSSLYAIHL
jgi:hypothetical protein